MKELSQNNPTYTLRGDRDTEYSFVRSHLPWDDGLLLDLGSDKAGELMKLGLSRGWTVVGMGLDPVPLWEPRALFIQRDFLEFGSPIKFDLVINVSTIEHFGIAGRYGVTWDDPDADLDGMKKLRSVMGENARMILTVPVGIGELVRPWHRVYGTERLERLLSGYHVIVEEFQAKRNNKNTYVRVSRKEALSVLPQKPPSPHYYALGMFVLEVDQ